MSSKSICFWLRCSILAIASGTVLLCAVWYPASFALIDIKFISVTSLKLSDAQIWIMLVFFWLAALPCFYILLIFWKVSTAVKKEELFTTKAAKWIKLCTVILFIDLAAFLIGNLVFLFMGINDFAVLHFALIIGGFVLGVLASSVSYYIAKAAELKEVNEGTI